MATFIGSLGAVGGGFVMNVALMGSTEWNRAGGLAQFRMSVLTKFGLFFALLYVLELSKFPFVPERNVIALCQAAVLAPGIGHVILRGSARGEKMKKINRIE